MVIDDEKRKRIAETEKLTDAERLCLDGFLISDLPPTAKSIIAYRSSRPTESKANDQAIYTQARRWLNTPKCKYYLEDKASQLNIDIRGVRNVEVKKDSKEGNVLRSKDETLEELNDLASSTKDPKLKAELLMKIADLQNWKKEQQTEESEQIKYYLPLKCSQCKLYKSAKMTKVLAK